MSNDLVFMTHKWLDRASAGKFHDIQLNPVSMIADSPVKVF